MDNRNETYPIFCLHWVLFIYMAAQSHNIKIFWAKRAWKFLPYIIIPINFFKPHEHICIRTMPCLNTVQIHKHCRPLINWVSSLTTPQFRCQKLKKSCSTKNFAGLWIIDFRHWQPHNLDARKLKKKNLFKKEIIPECWNNYHTFIPHCI